MGLIVCFRVILWLCDIGGWWFVLATVFVCALLPIGCWFRVGFDDWTFGFGGFWLSFRLVWFVLLVHVVDLVDWFLVLLVW